MARTPIVQFANRYFSERHLERDTGVSQRMKAHFVAEGAAEIALPLGLRRTAL